MFLKFLFNLVVFFIFAIRNLFIFFFSLSIIVRFHNISKLYTVLSPTIRINVALETMVSSDPDFWFKLFIVTIVRNAMFRTVYYDHLTQFEFIITLQPESLYTNTSRNSIIFNGTLTFDFFSLFDSLICSNKRKYFIVQKQSIDFTTTTLL